MYLRLLVLSVFCISLYRTEDLIVGTSANNVLAYSENVKLSAIVLSTRTKNVFYNSNTTRTIKGVYALDIDRSDARVTITAGGVGSTFVNVRLKSERGNGLNYLVQVFN